MTGLASSVRTLLSLGFTNVIRVGLYRIGIKVRIHPVQYLKGKSSRGPYYGSVLNIPPIKALARKDWIGGLGKFFGRTVSISPNDCPDWFCSLNGFPIKKDKRPWWKISDFDISFGDIKRIWEPSRFDWVIPMAQRAALGNTGELLRLNNWIKNWSKYNPPYFGVNWKCGQEASIRVMHLVTAAWIIGEFKAPKPGLVELIRLHLFRIEPTLHYAIGQANNHGTSEAAALFVGGSFIGGERGDRWMKMGRALLEDRAKTLFEDDGTFSQYSTVYHRLVLDTYSFAEACRRKFQLSPFSQKLMKRLFAATNWMEQTICPKTGQPPNLGANDGAHILAFTRADTRDFRPSLQLASILFRGMRINGPDTSIQPLIWFEIPITRKLAPSPKSITFDDGGLHVLRSGKAIAYLRYPRFRFRPSQADALNLDLWFDGSNLLRDAGTYSYNSTEKDLTYFSGTEAHNTIQFDGRDQMRRLGRFLFSDWLKAENVSHVHEQDETVTAAAAYRDYLGAYHHRWVSLARDELIARDTISGFSKQAILRWRLLPGNYSISDNSVIGETIRLNIISSMPIVSISLVNGLESVYYLEKTLVPVLEIVFEEPGLVETQIKF